MLQHHLQEPQPEKDNTPSSCENISYTLQAALELKPGATSLQARGAKDTHFSYGWLGFSDGPSVALQASDPMVADVQVESFTNLKQPIAFNCW